MKLLLILIILMLSGCATAGSIFIREDGVDFKTDVPANLTIKKDGIEATYDSRTPSLLRTVIEGAAVREINKD